MAPFLGPVLGPTVGAYIISEYDNWRFSMWVVLFIAAPIGIASLFMKETLETRILYLREKKKGVKIIHQTGDTRLLARKLFKAFIVPLHMMFVEVSVSHQSLTIHSANLRQPLVSLLSIYTGFAFAMMFSFFGSYSFVFLTIYHFTPQQIGLTFIGILVGFIFAVLTFGVFDATLYTKASAEADGKPAPEHRLYSAMLGSILLPIGLFWFAWAPRESVHWIVPVLAGVPFGWGSLTIFVRPPTLFPLLSSPILPFHPNPYSSQKQISATTYLVDVYQATNGASAVAANGILRYGFGAAFPLFTIQMYEAMGVHWAGSVFAFVALAMMPVPWIFFWKGKLLRARSYYKTSEY